MEYQQLSQTTYREDVLAQALYAREVEFFHYDFDRANYAEMLKTLPEGTYRKEIQERHDGTVEQMRNVDAIYAALQKQITDQDAHKAAVDRLSAKQKP